MLLSMLLSPGLVAAGIAARDDPRVHQVNISDANRLNLELLGSRIQKVGAADAGTYGGAYLSPSDGKVHVGLTDLSESARRRYAGRDSSNLAFHAVDNSWHALTQVQARVAADWSRLRSEGIALEATFPDARASRLKIEVRGLTRRQARLLTTRYGAKLVKPILVPGSVAGRRGADSRINDSAPWNGGDFITSLYEGTCTSGPPAYRQTDGKEFLITAGHCWPASRYVYNMRNWPALAGDRVVMGQTAYNTFRLDQSGSLDAALIWTDHDGGSSARDWRSDAVYATQEAWDDPMPGYPVCFSGAYTLERCGALVTDYDGCIRYADGLDVHCHESRAVNYDKLLAGDGDSGSPVYTVNPSTLKLNVKGIFVYFTVGTGQGRLPTCDRYPGTAAEPRRCGNVVYFTDIMPILHQWTLALKRG
jgi:hypothetical protein